MMRKLVVTIVFFGLSATGYAYSIKHSYSGKNNSTEYYGSCNNGQLLKIVEHADGRYSYEGPAGDGTVRGAGALDRAAAAACGE